VPSPRAKLRRYLRKIEEFCEYLGGRVDLVEEPGNRYVIRCVFPSPARARVYVKRYITWSEAMYINKPERAKLFNLVVEAEREHRKDALYFRVLEAHARSGVRVPRATLCDESETYLIDVAYSHDMRIWSKRAREIDFALDLPQNTLEVAVIE